MEDQVLHPSYAILAEDARRQGASVTYADFVRVVGPQIEAAQDVGARANARSFDGRNSQDDSHPGLHFAQSVVDRMVAAYRQQTADPAVDRILEPHRPDRGSYYVDGSSDDEEEEDRPQCIYPLDGVGRALAGEAWQQMLDAMQAEAILAEENAPASRDQEQHMRSSEPPSSSPPSPPPSYIDLGLYDPRLQHALRVINHDALVAALRDLRDRGRGAEDEARPASVHTSDPPTTPSAPRPRRNFESRSAIRSFRRSLPDIQTTLFRAQDLLAEWRALREQEQIAETRHRERALRDQEHRDNERALRDQTNRHGAIRQPSGGTHQPRRGFGPRDRRDQRRVDEHEAPRARTEGTRRPTPLFPLRVTSGSRSPRRTGREVPLLEAPFANLRRPRRMRPALAARPGISLRNTEEGPSGPDAASSITTFPAWNAQQRQRRDAEAALSLLDWPDAPCSVLAPQPIEENGEEEWGEGEGFDDTDSIMSEVTDCDTTAGEDGSVVVSTDDEDGEGSSDIDSITSGVTSCDTTAGENGSVLMTDDEEMGAWEWDSLVDELEFK